MHNSRPDAVLVDCLAQPDCELCIMNYELSKVFPDVAAEIFVGEMYLLCLGERLGQCFVLVLSVRAYGYDAPAGGYYLAVF